MLAWLARGADESFASPLRTFLPTLVALPTLSIPRSLTHPITITLYVLPH